LGYTTIGEQVGMAQRMESVTPPGGVMLSESTGRLVEDVVVLGEPEMVRIKGADEPVCARRLLGVSERRRAAGRAESRLVGRRGEMAVVEALLGRAIDGHGAVVAVVGSAGIGKSRLVGEVAATAAGRGVEVFSAFCESHATDVPFRVVARLLRAITGVGELDRETARAQIRAQAAGAGPQDMLLFDDLLGIADPGVELPKIDPDARRRRLTAFAKAASLARESPAVYIVEDAHWIDEVSESMLAEFLTVIPETPSLVLVTYRPHYRGVLANLSEAHTISLQPLSEPETAVLLDELLGTDRSVAAIRALITGRSAGNPFFAQEMVRELAQRGVLEGDRAGYVCRADVAEVNVPASLQAAIASRIDRLEPAAKKTLNAAAVIGSHFTAELLAAVCDEPILDDLVGAELIDQVRFTRSAEFAFRHPLIRAVAYESQLKSDRARLHRRLAAAIEAREPQSTDQNAALMAEHMEAAGDLRAAYTWHMRAGNWAIFRDIAAAQGCWRRACQVADRLPEDDSERTSMRVAPRTLLCGTAWRVVGGGAETGFNELRELCIAVGDPRSLSVGMSGLVMAEYMNARRRTASVLATELCGLLESIADPTLTVALSFTAMLAKHESGEVAEVFRLAERVIDLADGDPTRGNLVFPSPLTFAIGMRGVARSCLGIAGWRDDFRDAMAMARERASDPTILAGVMWFTYSHAIPCGVLLPDATAVGDTAEFSVRAEQFGDDLALEIARIVRGIVLVAHDGTQRKAGFDLLERTRERALRERFALLGLPIVDIQIAQEKARLGDLGGAIESARTVIDELFASGGSIWSALAASVLVEALLQRGDDGDHEEAQAVIGLLAAEPTDRGFVLHQTWLLRLRALMARARGDEAAYRDYRDRYRATARSLRYEGHMKWAEAMT
jgi:adenylate cyclase